MSTSESAIREILARKPETFEQAKRENAITEIRNRSGPAIGPGAAPVPQFETVTVPEVVPGEGVGFVESLKQGFIDDPDTRIRRLAKQKFPNDPNALQRFGVVDNEIVFVNDQGLLERAVSGGADLAGRVVAQTPEIAGSIIGSFATGGPLRGSALGAAGGAALKDFIAGAFFEDPKTPVGVAADMATEAGLDLAGGGVGKAVGRFTKRKAIEGVDESVFKSNAQKDAIKNATGIELDLAQVTNNPKLKALKVWARKHPGDAGEIIQVNDELIAGQVDKAINRVLGVISKETDTATLGKNAINAAEASIVAARVEVASKVSPLYTQAFESGARVEVTPILKLVDDKLKTAKGTRRTRLLEVRKLLKIPGKDTFDTSVQGLHGSKLAIDEMFERRGSEALGNTIRRDLVEIKGSLLDQLSTASPAYDEARRLFESETARLVDPLQNGIVGVLASVDDAKAATAAARMFADGNVTTEAIQLARDAIKPQDPEAWNGLVKQWLMHNLNAASKELQTGETVNLAGKFRQRVFGTRNQKEAMRKAIGPEAIDLFEMTMTALEFVSRTPTAGSDTAFNQLITRELEGGAGSIIRAATTPRATAIQSIEDAHLQKQARRIAEALTDPTKVKQLKALKELKPSTERTLIIAGVIGLSHLPRDFAGNILFPEETRVPPMLQRPPQ